MESGLAEVGVLSGLPVQGRRGRSIGGRIDLNSIRAGVSLGYYESVDVYPERDSVTTVRFDTDKPIEPLQLHRCRLRRAGMYELAKTEFRAQFCKNSGASASLTARSGLIRLWVGEFTSRCTCDLHPYYGIFN